MDILSSIKNVLEENPLKLVLPEGKDPRVVKAARELTDNGFISSAVLLGDPLQVELAAWEIGYNVRGIEIVNPRKSSYLEAYTSKLYNLRKHKGISLEQARTLVADPLYWGALMLQDGAVDAMVAGAACSTAKVLRAVFSVIGTRHDIRSVSSFNIMKLADQHIGLDGYMLFADCATIPDPSAEQLADIAISSEASFRMYFEDEPRIALLSFSTLGSANHYLVDKIRDALEIVRSRAPDLLIDGELQFDSAVIPSVAQKKAPDSPVAGKANILIFPDLNSANIGYKITQRLAHADMYGPCLQGLARPVSDLSRGCSSADIVNTSLITLMQAQVQYKTLEEEKETSLVADNV